MTNKIEQNSVRELDYAQNISQGGTSSMTVDSAEQKMGWIRRQKLGVNGGVAKLTANKKIPIDTLGGVTDLGKAITIGPNALAYGKTDTNFQITNYDSFTTYTVATTNGTVSISEDTITYTPQNENGVGGFTVNGEAFPVTVVARRPDTPTITSPVNNSTGLGKSVSFTSTAFNMTGTTDTHQASHWQISTSPTFANIVAETVDDAVNKTSWSYTPLNPATQYYVRLRYKGATYGYSNWSSTITISTMTRFIPSSEQKKIVQSPAAASDNLGRVVALSDNGDTLVVGAPYKFVKYGVSGGAIFIFVRSGSTWTQQAMLSADDISGVDFGSAVAISGDGNTVVAGAGIQTSPGYAYIFTRSGTTWSLQGKLTGPDSVSSDQFGWSVALSTDGNRLVVCASNRDTKTGSVHIFNRSGTTWTPVKMYNLPDAVNDSFLGLAVSISGDGTVIAVGNPNQSDQAGAVYIFRYTGGVWGAGVKIKPPGNVELGRFGASVCLSKDKTNLIVGAPNKDNNKGASYIFSFDGTNWVQRNKTFGGEEGYLHGYSVSISSDGATAIVGTPMPGASGASNAWILTRSGDVWTFQTALIMSDYVADDHAGWGVSISADASTICVGAPGNDNGGLSGSGAAYIFV